LTTEAVEDGDVEELGDDEGGTGGEGDAQGRERGREDEADGEADPGDATGERGTGSTVADIGNEIGDRIGKRAPGEPRVDGDCTSRLDTSTMADIARAGGRIWRADVIGQR